MRECCTVAEEDGERRAAFETTCWPSRDAHQGGGGGGARGRRRSRHRERKLPAGLRGKFTVGEEIGRGTCGVVHVGARQSDGELVAIKFVRPGQIEPSQVAAEVGLMRALPPHPNVVGLLDADLVSAPRSPVLVLEVRNEVSQHRDTIAEQRKSHRTETTRGSSSSRAVS